jgi:anti-sigma factor RsiW
MRPNLESLERECKATRALLSEYIENTLSARQAWEVEKHLAACRECTQFGETLKATVTLLQNAPGFDTSEDFMARLHARMDTLEPQALRRPTFVESLCDRGTALWQSLRIHRVPALGASLVALILVVGVTFRQPTPSATTASHPVETQALLTEPLHQSVALAANDPLEDPAAANLEAHTALNENGSSSETGN